MVDRRVCGCPRWCVVVFPPCSRKYRELYVVLFSQNASETNGQMKVCEKDRCCVKSVW